MTKTAKIALKDEFFILESVEAKSLLPHYESKQVKRPAFRVFKGFSDTTPTQKRHKGLKYLDYMRPPSEPAINTNNEKEWFIYWNHDVPYPLWPKYHPRKRVRIRINDDINRLKGDDRIAFAEERRLIWKYKLEKLNFNPFEEELAELERVSETKNNLVTKLTELEEERRKLEELSEEDKRKLLPVDVAFKAFIASREKRKITSGKGGLKAASIVSYQNCVDWLLEGLKATGNDHLTINQLRHIHLSAALDYIAEDRKWVATTINKGVEFMMTVFNWLATHDYIDKNPSKGKFEPLPTLKTKHRWFDRETKKKVLDHIKTSGNLPLLRACQFTYEIMIRSKSELRMLQVGDFDRELRRVRFRAELAKTDQETYRDYSDEVETMLNEMEIHKYPANYYVFGSKDGQPGSTMCGHNYFSKMFKAVKDKLGLSMDYTIYGFKHTRIVHELMKGTDGNDISEMARHTDRKSTKDYQRDYDLSLKKIYQPEDLKF